MEGETRERRHHIATFIVDKLMELQKGIQQDLKQLEEYKAISLKPVRVIRVDARETNNDYPDSLTF